MGKSSSVVPTDEVGRASPTNDLPPPTEAFTGDRNKAAINQALNEHHATFVHQEKGKLSLLKKISYGAPMFSVTSLTMLIGIHGMMFYTRIGADVAFLAFFTALARSFDVVTDPMMGWISDKTRSKWGRRRPYMATGCWGYALLFILLFSPPKSLGSTGVALWFGFFYVVFYLFDTMSNVPHGALGPELSDDCNERNKVFLFANIFKAVGILMAATGPVGLGVVLQSSVEACACHKTTCPSVDMTASELPASWNGALFGTYNSSVYNKTLCNLKLATDLTDEERAAGAYRFDGLLPGPEAWCACRKRCSESCSIATSRIAMQTIAVAFGVYYILSILNCVFQISEREGVDMANPPIVPSLLATVRNKPFMGLLPAWVCDMTSYTMIGTMMPFYLEYVVSPKTVPQCADGRRAFFGFDSPGAKQSELWCQTDTWLGLGLVALMGANIVSMPLWLFLAKRFGKYRAWMMYNLSTAVTNGMFVFVGEGDPKLCMCMAFLNGLPAGAQFINDAIVADTIDYDEFLTGFRSEGRFTIFQTFIPKIVSVPSQAIPLALLSVFGFLAPVNGVPRPQPNAVKWFIKIVFYVLPCFFALLSFVLKTRFPIKSQALSDKIIEGNAIHAAGHPAVDPLTGLTVRLFPIESKEQEVYTWRMDNFQLKGLQMLRDRGAAPLIAKMRKNMLLCAASTAFFFVIVVVSISSGLLSHKMFAFVPAFSVIAFGISMTLTLVGVIRLKAAKRMKTDPIPDDFLRSWVSHREGSFEVALNDLPEHVNKEAAQRRQGSMAKVTLPDAQAIASARATSAAIDSGGSSESVTPPPAAAATTATGPSSWKDSDGLDSKSAMADEFSDALSPLGVAAAPADTDSERAKRKKKKKGRRSGERPKKKASSKTVL